MSELCFKAQIQFIQEERGTSGGGDCKGRDVEVCVASGEMQAVH